MQYFCYQVEQLTNYQWSPGSGLGAAGLCTSPGAAGTCRFLSNRLPGNKKESIGQQQNYLFFVCC